MPFSYTHPLQNHESWDIMRKTVKEGAFLKQLVCWLLAVVLCIGLSGCAMGDGYGKYANIYRLLDAGDYAGAHAAIDALAGISSTTAPVTQAPAIPPTTAHPTEPTTMPQETVPPTTTPVDPENATYVLNTSSMKIHKPKCGSVETIKEENRKYTNLTREELIAQGYEPCGRCKP